MDAQLLEEARRAFNAARIARVGVTRRINNMLQDADADLAAIQRTLERIEREIDVAQAAHDQMQKHADTRLTRIKKQKKRRKRLISNIVRRNQHGERAKALRAEYLAEQAKLHEAQELQRTAERTYGLHQANRTYYNARHLYMLAISLAEADDAAMAERKLDLMRRADIPPGYGPQDVWYYEYSYGGRTKIHLFYGGTVAPMGDDMSPDGDGHGHVELLITEDGDCSLLFSRPPQAA